MPNTHAPTDGYRDAYENTTGHLHRLQGLASLLNDVLVQRFSVTNGDKQLQGILALIETLDDGLADVPGLRDMEWHEASQRAAPDRKPCSDMVEVPFSPQTAN